jgi:hypothetical protein
MTDFGDMFSIPIQKNGVSVSNNLLKPKNYCYLLGRNEKPKLITIQRFETFRLIRKLVNDCEGCLPNVNKSSLPYLRQLN